MNLEPDAAVTALPYDLVVKGGRLLDPASGTDGRLDVAFSSGRVAAIAQDIAPAPGTRVVDAGGKIVVPGLVDLHTHIYWGATSLGVDAAAVGRSSGTTPFVDAGSAGAGNFAAFRRFIVDATDLHVLAFLNISYAGIFGVRLGGAVGECGDLRLLDAAECARTIDENRDVIVGVKVRLGEGTGETQGTRSLEIARGVADRLNVPIMAHIDSPPPKIDEVLAFLRRGDIWTHCCRGAPNSLLSAQEALEPEFLAVQTRGVLV